MDGDAGRAVSMAPTLPCLTILCHPQLGRVGERAQLKRLMVHSPALLSRNEPTFVHPGAREGRPLDDPFLSRAPITFEVVGSSGAIRVSPSKPGLLRVGNVPVDDPVEIARADLARGVLLELRQRVLLLLHLTTGREPTELPGIVGASDAIEDVRRQIVQVATTDVTVLVRGETGVGKELAAQALHACSPRKDAPCVVVNMATIGAEMAASTLFGHEKGAFTGADRRHQGLFERAAGGTLFLDELGETPDAVQPMLLRALETKSILPVGAQTERALDVRLVAATDIDLEQGVRDGNFRSALLHRLSGYEIRIPPLRERRDDIARLFVRFLTDELGALDDTAWLQHDAREAGIRVPTSLVAELVEHELPGNVRQLRNLVRTLVLNRDGAAQLDATIGIAPATARPPAAPDAVTLRPPRPTEISDEALEAALEENGWAPGKTARALGIPASTLHDLIARSSRVRKAKDLGDEELRASRDACDGDSARMARSLRVSERALRMVLKERGLL